MSPAPAIRPAARRGFTLIELMIVISVILILATMFLAIKPGNPEGLGNGQRMVADMLRIARVQAMMNRAAAAPPAGSAWGSNTTTLRWTPANFRYRLLIKCDPSNPDTHLREMVLAIGCTGIGGSPALYTWHSPEPSVLLPPGVYFVPPNLAAVNGITGGTTTNPAVTMPSGTSIANTAAVSTRVSRIPGLGDTAGLVAGANEYHSPAATTQAPMMLYRPVNLPVVPNLTTAIYYNNSSVHTVANGARYWYYVELGPDGGNNHLGKVVLVVAEGINTGAAVRLAAPDKFAAILVRRNGDVSLTTDTDDLEAGAAAGSTLLK